MFPNKNWSLGGLKALMQKMTTQVLLFAVVGSGRPRIVRAVPVLSIFWSVLSVHQDFSFWWETVQAIALLHISYFLVKIWLSTVAGGSVRCCRPSSRQHMAVAMPWRLKWSCLPIIWDTFAAAIFSYNNIRLTLWSVIDGSQASSIDHHRFLFSTLLVVISHLA